MPSSDFGQYEMSPTGSGVWTLDPQVVLSRKVVELIGGKRKLAGTASDRYTLVQVLPNVSVS